MKNSTLVLLFLLFACFSNAQIISFSDPAFKAKLLESNATNFIARDLNGDYFSIDSNTNGEIEVTEALQVGFLEIDNSSISSLAEINNFAGLTSLNCEGNLLTTLDISGLSVLTLFNCSNNQLGSLNVNGATELQELNCQFNQLLILDAGGIPNLLHLNCSYNQINALNLVNLLSLELLNCSNNAITAFDLSDLVSLKSFDCSYNQLTTINTSNLTSLEILDCSSNALGSITLSGLINFTNLNCSANQLTSLNLINLLSLTDLNSNFNQLVLINVNDLTGLKNFSCTNNQLSSLNLTGLSLLENINCSSNLIATIDLIGLNQLISLNCTSNQLTILEASTLTSLKYLYADYNPITTLNINGLEALLVISCSHNQITALNFASVHNVQSLYCSDNQISTLDLSTLPNLQNLFCANNNLVSLFIKNGSFENNLQFSGNPNLTFICADESQIDFVHEEINNNNGANCHVNSYCSFVPGGISYSLQGSIRFDGNTNGCEASDASYSNMRFSFYDGMNTEELIGNGSGAYSKSVNAGSYIITPTLENPNYFSVTPSTLSVDFPETSSPLVQNFCVTANGPHSDVEIAILPLGNAIPGLDANYKIIYKNKGTVTQSGTVNLNFDDAVLNLVQSNPTNTSQSANNLNWAFINLNPLETRSILLRLNLNASLNAGQLLPFTVSATTTNTDETPIDNIIRFNQTVEASAISNNKICIEGHSVSTTQVGEFVHYCIRFKNEGSAMAQNVVVKDVIDSTKYDVASLFPLDGSHVFETRITNLNLVEFIFENISLASGSDGYVMFKVKTLPTLVNGNTFTNTASIYFDYNTPLSSNTESTTVQVLANPTFEASHDFTVYPNPVKEVVNLRSGNSDTITSIGIYNLLGQLIKTIASPTNSINVTELKQGIYFLSVTTAENRISSVKFIKE